MDTPSTLAPFPLLPTLETFRIRQATFVDPWRMVEVILGLAGIPDGTFKEMQLVDVYMQSIWGPRLRRSDLELAVSLTSPVRDGVLTAEDAKGVVRKVVKCRARTERKYGGDRVGEDASDELF